MFLFEEKHDGMTEKSKDNVNQDEQGQDGIHQGRQSHQETCETIGLKPMNCPGFLSLLLILFVMVGKVTV